MKIEERAVEGVTILDLQGKMLIGEGDELLREKINSLVEKGTEKIVLNLEDVPYVDSAGLGEIVRCYTNREPQERRAQASASHQADSRSALDHETSHGLRHV